MATMKDTKMQPAKDAVIEELRKVIADCYWPTSPVAINEILDRLESAEKERDNLRAKIEAMEKQVPICRAEDLRHAEILLPSLGLMPEDKLYALPGAQGEEK